MGTQVSRAQGFACHIRIKAPGQPARGLLGDGGDDPVLGMSCAEIDDLSDDAFFDHLPRLPDGRIGGVGVRDGKKKISFIRDLFQVFRLFHGHGDRLVAQDVDIFFHKIFCNLIMAGVGRRNRDKIDSVLAGGFLVRHFLIICIDPVFRNLPGVRCLQIFVPMAGKTAGTQYSQIIHHCAVAVYVTYIGSETAANHSVSYFFQGKMPPFPKISNM